MISRNLRHFRVFLAVAELKSPTQASEVCRVSQPAITQSLSKLEREAGGPLFERTRQGFFLTERGTLFETRIRRALVRLDLALTDISPRLTVTATTAQLQSLIAMTEAENFSLAARRLGIAQPTVHRAVTQIEHEAARSLFERTSYGMVATRPCRALAQAARLAFAEIDQAEAELAEFDGREAGQIVIGTLPLGRSAVLPTALAAFRKERFQLPITIIEAPYEDLLGGLRRGDLDIFVGAMRKGLPVDDVVQEPLFNDRLKILARPDHPLVAASRLRLEDLRDMAWVLPRVGAPTRDQLETAFSARGLGLPASIIECGSILLMRGVLRSSDMIGCISELQAQVESAHGLLSALDVRVEWPDRPIGLTYRKGWMPTRAQTLMLDLIRQAVPPDAAI